MRSSGTLVDRKKRFGGNCCLRLLGRRDPERGGNSPSLPLKSVPTRRDIPEHDNIHEDSMLETKRH
jgi:hypothetical protein